MIQRKLIRFEDGYGAVDFAVTLLPRQPPLSLMGEVYQKQKNTQSFEGVPHKKYTENYTLEKLLQQ